MENHSLILQELQQAAGVLDTFISNPENLARIDRASQLIADSFGQGGKVISCGNGGSHCDAMHFAEELTGRFRDHRPGLPAIAISDPSYMSCASNDYGFDQVFARFVQALGKKNDVLLGITTSGNSINVIKAVEEAKQKDMKVITLTGKDGGQIGGMSDIEIRVEHDGYSDRIQEIHIKIIHILILLIEKRIG